MVSVDHTGSNGDPLRYEALLEMADLMVLHPSLPELLARLSERLHKVILFEIANFALHDTVRNVMRIHIWEGHDCPMPTQVPIEECAGGWVWQNQLPVVMPDILSEKRPSRVFDALKQKGIRSFCMVPLTTSHTRFGAMGMGSSRLNAYSEGEIRFLTRVAKLVALDLENLFTREVLVREKAAFSSLLDLNAKLRSSLELRDIIPLISACLGKIVAQEHVSLALHQRGSQSLCRYPAEDPAVGPEVVGAGRTAIDCAAYRAFEAGETRIFRRQDLKIESGLPELRTQPPIQSLCCVPLFSADGLLGTLNVGSIREDAFDTIDISILQQVAGQLAVALDNARAYREIAELKEKLANETLYLEAEIRSERNFEEIIGDSPVLKHTLSQAKTVAPSGATTLILGETGTGKELIARAIHRMSTRKNASFIKLNCAAMPTGLLESELFGHEKGAFTGAISQKIGRLELADKGTLLLDEVGDIPLELQPKLLRVLQDQEFERLGSNRTIKVDVRLIAATNRDLAKLVSNHEFRSDLYYRLSVFPIVVPPLREREGDLEQLVRYFVQKLSRRMDKKIETIPATTMKALRSWSWPGNVRELENFIERSVILSDGPVLRAPLAELRPDDDGADSETTLREVERRHIIRVLRESQGVIAGARGAALKLGLKRTTLQSRMQKLKITRQEYLR